MGAKAGARARDMAAKDGMAARDMAARAKEAKDGATAGAMATVCTNLVGSTFGGDNGGGNHDSTALPSLSDC